MPEIPNPRLVVMRAGQVLAEHEVTPEREVVLGRTPQCQVTIDHNTVSRMHARIYADAQGVYLEDLGSANGTFVDGERVLGVVKLNDGQLVRPGQKTLATPIVVRFEDPAKRLLEQMGLLSARETAPQRADSETHPQKPAAAKTGPAPGPAGAPQPPARQAPTVPLAPPAPRVEAPPEAPADPFDEPPPPPPPRRILPLLLAAGLLALVGLGAFFWWMSRVLKPAATQWQTVELSTYEATPGSELELKSGDIQPGDVLQVRFGERALTGAEVLPGRLRFTVPDLGDRPAGSYPIPLVIHEGELEVFSATLNYTIEPRITGISPRELRVGDTLTITGTALPESKSKIQVAIGSEKAEVLEASATHIAVRVPLVTREGVSQLAVTVRSGDWESRPDELVRVGPKLPQPLDFAIAAQYRADLQAWELATPVGPLFLLRAPAPAGGQPPPVVRQAQDRLHQLVALAADDRELQVETVPAGSGYRLQSVSPGKRAQTLVELSEADLVATARDRRLDTTPDVFAFWMAKVWNHLLATFARGEKPAAGSPAPGYVPVLTKLVEAATAAGGSGRPEATDLERLTASERATLANAFWTVPAGYGTVAGHWTLVLDNVFYPEDQYTVELQLDLRQNGRSLSGRGQVFLQSSGITLRVPETAVTGSLGNGVPPRVKLHLSCGKPVGELDLEGVFENGALAGAFSASQAKRPGTWKGARQGVASGG